MPRKEPKKASAKRGYMTKEEVSSHLDGLKTEIGKAKYLDKILSKKSLLAPKTYEAVQESADETYGKMAVEAVKKGRFSNVGTYSNKIKNKKLANDVYGKMAVEAVKKEWFGHAEKFVGKIKDKKVIEDMYGKMAVEAVKKGWFRTAEEFAGKAGNDKLADEIYGKMAVEAVKKEKFEDAGRFAGKIKDKGLADDTYGKVAVEAAGKRVFGYARRFAEKGEKYLTKNNPNILADIYEEIGEVIKAKDIRKRLEREKK